MKLCRQLNYGRTLLVLSAVWITFMFVVISFFWHEPNDPRVSARITSAMKSLSDLQKKHVELSNLLIELSSRLEHEDQQKILSNLKRITHSRFSQPEPGIDYEQLRRRIYSNVHELWYFFQSQITDLQRNSYSQQNSENMGKMIDIMAEYKRSLLFDIDLLQEKDGYQDWRNTESILLSNLIQRRLHYLQNPQNCESAKKLVCDLNKGCGYGCQLHHVVYCFIVAYGTERTLILKSKGWRYSRLGWEKVFLPISETCLSSDGETQSKWPGTQLTQVITLPIIDSLSPRPDYLPLSIPEDIADRLGRLHGDPIVWWIGQFLKYLLRPQPSTKQMIEKFADKLGFKKPIVGIHIRRTDKVGTEAAFHKLEEYMIHVDEYYKQLQMKNGNADLKHPRRVFIATDEPKIFEEAKHKYPNYEIIGNMSISKTASMNSRYTESSLYGIISDIHFLSLCDYIVCTFSSQVCRVAYELMNSVNSDSWLKFRSLDDVYYYGGQKGRFEVAILPHKANNKKEIELRIGDTISVAGNHWDGYSKGMNMRSYEVGLYPTFKVMPKLDTAKFPPYPAVPLEELNDQ